MKDGYNAFFPLPLLVGYKADGRTLVLLEDFKYIDPLLGELVVPAGTETDLASIPRPLWMLLPPFGKYAFAAVIHDMLYGARPYGVSLKGWRKCDRTFWRAMKLSPHRVSAATRVLIYLGLLIGGWAVFFRVTERAKREVPA